MAINMTWPPLTKERRNFEGCLARPRSVSWHSKRNREHFWNESISLIFSWDIEIENIARWKEWGCLRLCTGTGLRSPEVWPTLQMAQCLLGNVQLWRPGLWSRFSIRAKLSSHWALQCILGHSFIFCCSFMCTPLELKASPLEKWALACPCSSAGRKEEKNKKRRPVGLVCVQMTIQYITSHLTERVKSLFVQEASRAVNQDIKVLAYMDGVRKGWISYCMC